MELELIDNTIEKVRFLFSSPRCMGKSMRYNMFNYYKINISSTFIPKLFLIKKCLNTDNSTEKYN